ncbi:ankyrin repeat and SOCS box protein 12-like [Hyperolius riggenbachi]|uniref:ankyrin repeat and SOCS box protein 12-like n=1 Tax=Hyperolius riggenbachi TaxID=752182 RepID=UPI0035A39606
MIFRRSLKMSVMDITKMFAMLKPKEEEEALEESRELHLAVAMDNPEYLAFLLADDKYRKFLNSRSGWGVPVTPLRLAASKGSLECLKTLLSHGAEVDILDVKAQTPLFAAVCAGHFDCVRELLKAGASPSGSVHNNGSPVLTAAREGSISILRELLENGAEPNVKCKLPDWAASNTISTGPLYLSAVYGHLECFRTLLFYGADPDYNCTDERILKRIKQPKTVLDVCLKHGCKTAFVKLLIDYGANVYVPDLTIVKSFPNQEAVELLTKERGHPKSLMSQCRLAILKLIRQAGKTHLPDQLEIPQTMTRYLMHQT